MSKDKRIIKIYGTFTNGCEDTPLLSGEEIADSSISENKLDEGLKDKLKRAVFIGSQSEYNEAYSKGEIALSTLVIILEENESTADTIALLGTAVLGKMVLGNN